MSGWSLALIVTLGVAFLLRIWELGSLPRALHPDEMAGYSGVLDELTRRAPLRAFFDYRIMYLPLYGVSQFVATWFFGNTPAGLRFPAVVFGVATVYFTIELTRRLTVERVTALLAGAIMAILPWDVVVSRVGWEPAAMLPFILSGLVALHAGLYETRPRLLLAAGVAFGIATYSYRAALPDSIVLAAAMIACNVPRARAMWRSLAGAAAVWCALALPLIVSVAADQDFFWRDRRIATFAQGIDRHSLGLFAQNYFAHFTLVPLFLAGDGNPNHGPNYGVLYPWMAPFLAAGVWFAWKRYGRRAGVFLLTWLALYPLGGALTNDGVPHFLRALIGAPLACIFCAMGLAGISDLMAAPSRRVYRMWGGALLAVLIFVELCAFCFSYFIAYAATSADAYQYPNRELFASLRTLEPNASRVCFLDINGMNSLTLFAYYMRGTHLDLIEGEPPQCMFPGTLIVTGNASRVPGVATLVATIPNYEGGIADYIYRK